MSTPRKVKSASAAIFLAMNTAAENGDVTLSFSSAARAKAFRSRYYGYRTALLYARGATAAMGEFLSRFSTHLDANTLSIRYQRNGTNLDPSLADVIGQ